MERPPAKKKYEYIHTYIYLSICFTHLAVQLVEEAVEDEVGGVVVLEHLRLGHPHAALRHPVSLDAVGWGGGGGVGHE